MLRVMIVSPDPAVRAELRACFPPDDPRVTLAAETAQGALALIMVRDLMPDLVIADADSYLGGVNSFCREIYMDFPWIRVLRVTSHDIVYDPVPWGDVTLLRPVRAEDLRDAVEREIRRARALTAELRAGLLDDVPEKPGAPEKAPLYTLDLFASAPVRARMARLMRRNGNRFAPGITETDSYVRCAVTGADAEEDAYRSAYALVRAAQRLFGEKPRVRVNGCEDPFTVAGPGDRLIPAYAPPLEPTILTELLPSAFDPCEILGFAERFSSGSAEDASYACRRLIGEITGRMPDEEKWAPRGDRDAILDQLAEAIALRRKSAPGYETHVLSLSRAALCRSIPSHSLDPTRFLAANGISESRMRLIFQMNLGVTATEYLMRLRCDLAARMYARTNRRASAIARETGRDDTAHMLDRYRRLRGEDLKALRAKKKTDDKNA